MKQLKPFCVWFIGLPSSGKTTTADALKEYFDEQKLKTIRLDGDVVRKGINSDLGLSDADRDENNRRIMYISQLLVENDIPVINSFIAPFESIRERSREIIPNYIEVFVDTPIEECIKRDVKGLYAKAQSGEIKGMTGIDSPFETPKNADIVLKTVHESVEENLRIVIDYLIQQGFIQD